jgi:phosphodiesterase/alkaline phosphatase D-like protein
VVPTTAILGSLTPNTKYFFRLVGSNSTGSLTSPVYRFTTKSSLNTAPIVTVSPATSVTAYSAQINGSVNANGLVTDVHIIYSSDINFQTNVKTISGVTNSSLYGSSVTAFKTTPVSLLEDTSYYYKILAFNSAGISSSEVMTFKTLIAPGLPPTIVANEIKGLLSNTSQIVTGVVNPQSQATTVTFTYARDAGFTNTVVTVTLPIITGDTDTAISVELKGLVPAAGYHMRFDASNASGMTFGNKVSGAVTSVMPVISSQTHSLVTDTSVKFTSVINAGGNNTRNAFEYSTSPTFESATVINGTPFALANAITTTVNAAPIGLIPGTTYYFRARLISYSGVFEYKGYM